MGTQDKYITSIHCNHCGSSDANSVYESKDGNRYTYCFSCGKKGDNMSDEDEDELFALQETPVVNNSTLSKTFSDLRSRGIDKAVCEIYKVKVHLDDKGNDLVHYYPMSKGGRYTNAMCIREVNGKKFSWVNAKESGDFFGQVECGIDGKLIIVTEGCADTLAAKQMLLDQGKNYRVCSVINGAQSAVNDFKRNYEWINSFDTILLAFDMDKPGQDAAKKVAEMFTVGKVKILDMSEKDANDMLRAGKSLEFLRTIYNAKAEKVQGVLSIEDLYDEALRPSVMGLSYPWESLTKAVYGLRTAEIIGIGAAPGSGKTQVLKEIIDHSITVHGIRVGACFLEENPAMSAKQLAGIRHSKKFHLPQETGGWELKDLKEGLDYLKDKVFLYDSLGSKSWEDIESKVRFMVATLGVTLVIIDNLTALLSAETDDFKALNNIMPSMSTLAIELDITIIFVSHLRKKQGTSHSEGGDVSLDDFRGSQAVSQWSNLLLCIIRDQTATDEIERNTSTIKILKDRYSGEGTGVTFKLFYDKETGRMKEVNHEASEFDDE